VADKKNYLLGYGERLTSPVDVGSGGGPKHPPYTPAEARDRVGPMLTRAASALESLPEKACPQGQAVVSITLHPEYYAKSYFPGALLRQAELRPVGSRSRTIKPKKRSRGRKPEETVTTELFVAGARSSFRRLADRVSTSSVADSHAATGFKQLVPVEDIHALTGAERMRPLHGGKKLPLEIVLHASESWKDRFILAGFQDYLAELELEPDLTRVFYAGGLCFLRMKATKRQARKVADYSFLRVVREMPRLRTTQPILRGQLPRPRKIQLPSENPVDPSLRVAVFDGGLPKTSPLQAWATSHEVPGIGAPDDGLLWHGETVTSAVLFGSAGGETAARPLCKVDHHRVLDKDSVKDPFELYEVLERIKLVLGRDNYEFFNLSIGPTLAVEDEEVHAWTSVLDEYLSDGRCLATIAAGNTGEEPEDPVLQNWRIQVPSDCVNGLTVGATDRCSGDWKRASYSSKGPGRSPGIVKPDVVSFGGSEKEPFWVTDPDTPGRVVPTAGTSYAAPATLRSGVAIRAHLGSILSPLATKALLIHGAEQGGHPRDEVGWGVLPQDLDDLMICPDGMVRVVYQDEISPANYRRIRLPLPRSGLQGKVHITATFCFATAVDPEHSGNYTKSGLAVIFRPNENKFKGSEQEHADSAPFFQPKKLYAVEQELRGDAHKWETCLHERRGKLATSLDAPVFDIHYNARSEGHDDSSASKIRYALVLSIESPKTKDLYDRVVRAYRTLLQPLNPVIEIPVQTSIG